MFMKNLQRRIATPRAIASARSNDAISAEESTLVDSITTPSDRFDQYALSNDENDAFL